MGNEDFRYGISGFAQKYGRETVFSTLDVAVITGKNNEKSALIIIKNSIAIFGLFCLFFILRRYKFLIYKFTYSTMNLFQTLIKIDRC